MPMAWRSAGLFCFVGSFLPLSGNDIGLRGASTNLFEKVGVLFPLFLFVQNATKAIGIYFTERWKPNEKKSQCEIQETDDTPCCAQAADHEKGGKKTGKVSCTCGPCVCSYAPVQKSRCVNAKGKLQPLCSGRYIQSAGERMAGMAKEGYRRQ